MSKIASILLKEFKIKSLGTTKPNQMATFVALGDIAIALWFERETFSYQADLEDNLKKTWCAKFNTSEFIAHTIQTFQKEDGHIRVYTVKFEELKRFVGI